MRNNRFLFQNISHGWETYELNNLITDILNDFVVQIDCANFLSACQWDFNRWHISCLNWGEVPRLTQKGSKSNRCTQNFAVTSFWNQCGKTIYPSRHGCLNQDGVQGVWRTRDSECCASEQKGCQKKTVLLNLCTPENSCSILRSWLPKSGSSTPLPYHCWHIHEYSTIQMHLGIPNNIIKGMPNMLINKFP